MPLDQGEVDITLADELETLRCTLGAIKMVTSHFGSYLECLRRLADMNHDAYVIVVAAGLGKKPKEVEQAVANTGLPNLTGPLSDYIALLTHGGKLPSDDATAAGNGSGKSKKDNKPGN